MSAYVLCGYMSEPLVKFFGPSWFLGGTFAITFINGGVQQGDAITCGGSIQRTTRTDAGEQHELAVWIDKAGGKRVATGTASGTRRAM